MSNNVDQSQNPNGKPFEFPSPRSFDPKIGLIGCGYVSSGHLRACKDEGYDVVALCNRTISKAKRRRDEFYPEADVYSDYKELLHREDVDVVIVATHPRQREPILKNAISEGKHILSQKPFAVDIDVAEQIVQFAETEGVKLAVHQPLRWNPEYKYIIDKINQGCIGNVVGSHLTFHFDHEDEILGTKFEDIHHILLYDLGIHYFDYIATLLPGKIDRVSAMLENAPHQKAEPPLLAQAIIKSPDSQASIIMDACTKNGGERRVFVSGSKGSLSTIHHINDDSTVLRYTTSDDHVVPELSKIENAANRGTINELLCAIETDREPFHSGKNNIRSLELCFAAVASAEDEAPKIPGDIRKMRGSVK